jgi:hypothetical protein
MNKQLNVFFIILLPLMSISYGYTIGKAIDDGHNYISRQESFARDKLVLMLYDVPIIDEYDFEPSDDMFKPLSIHCSGAIYEQTVGNPEIYKGLHLITKCEPNTNDKSIEVDLIDRAWESALQIFHESVNEN